MPLLDLLTYTMFIHFPMSHHLLPACLVLALSSIYPAALVLSAIRGVVERHAHGQHPISRDTGFIDSSKIGFCSKPHPLCSGDLSKGRVALPSHSSIKPSSLVFIPATHNLLGLIHIHRQGLLYPREFTGFSFSSSTASRGRKGQFC